MLRLPRVGALSLLGGHTRHLVGILGLQPGSDVLQRGMTSLAQPKKKVKEITVLDDALTQLKAMPERKFTQGVDLALRLNIDPRKSDQALRGLAVLPHGTGKKIRIAVFATGAAAEEATKAGATIVGGDDLIDKVQKGFIDFDRCIATPVMMKPLSKVARILGPRGLMPNPKLGTVTEKVAQIISELNSGVTFKADKAGIVHTSIGNMKFSNADLTANLFAVMKAVNDARPKGVKEPYVLSAFVAGTMTDSVKLNPKEIMSLGATQPAAGDSAAVQVGAHKATSSSYRWVDKAKEIDWDSVDPATVLSKKLRRYLEARRELAVKRNARASVEQ